MLRQKVRPCLWFDGKAEEAARFYVSIFPDSTITRMTPGPDGQPMMVEFQLAGSQFLALNGGPHFQFNEAISLSIDCATQEEVDTLWDRLVEGGSPGHCGWLKDRFGLSWQVVPSALMKLMTDPDPQKVGRMSAALRQMSKLDLRVLEAAAKGD